MITTHHRWAISASAVGKCKQAGRDKNNSPRVDVYSEGRNIVLTYSRVSEDE
jgi:hypothetical protein